MHYVQVGGATGEAMSKKRAKFRVGQVVRVNGHYLKIRKHVYDPTDRVAAWDNGHWYYEDDEKKSCYSENCLRPLTLRERGQP